MANTINNTIISNLIVKLNKIEAERARTINTETMITLTHLYEYYKTALVVARLENK